MKDELDTILGHSPHTNNLYCGEIGEDRKPYCPKQALLELIEKEVEQRIKDAPHA